MPCIKLEKITRYGGREVLFYQHQWQNRAPLSEHNSSLHLCAASSTQYLHTVLVLTSRQQISIFLDLETKFNTNNNFQSMLLFLTKRKSFMIINSILSFHPCAIKRQCSSSMYAPNTYLYCYLLGLGFASHYSRLQHIIKKSAVATYLTTDCHWNNPHDLPVRKSTEITL